MLVALVALVVEVGLRLGTLPQLTRLLGIQLINDCEPDHKQNLTVPPELPIAWVRQKAFMVNRVLQRSPFGDTCLRRALVLGQRIRGLDPILMIGVRHDDSGTVAAHAWLVVAGVALDPLAEEYEALRDLDRE